MDKPNLLKETLINEGITQSELHREAGVSLTTINKLCNHKRDVSRTTKSKLMRAINQLSSRKYEYKEIFKE